MFRSLVDAIFGCSHQRTTFPITRRQSLGASVETGKGTYITCLDCGQELPYNWQEMRVDSGQEKRPAPEPNLAPGVFAKVRASASFLRLGH